MKKKKLFVLIIVLIILSTGITNVYGAFPSFQEDEEGEAQSSDTKKTQESPNNSNNQEKDTFKEDAVYKPVDPDYWNPEEEQNETWAEIKSTDLLGEVLLRFGKWIIDFFITGLGDLIQATTNTLQTYALNTNGKFPTVMYSEDDIKKNNDINQYINIDETYYTTRTKYKSKDYNFNLENDAQFPLIVVDGYSLSVGKVATTDINFLSIDKKIHNNNKGFWDIIRNFAVALVRAAIYLSAAALITSLIYHGIVVVGNVYQSAQKRAEHQEGFNRFIKSVLMLVASVLIMALIISASQMIIRSILSDTNTNEFPIQVIDKTSGKKFSTNFTGYYRYKCQSNDIGERASSAFIYFIFAICNFLIAIFMILRFLVIIGFSVYGIALSVIYIIKKQDFDGKFLTWGIWYAVIAVVPAIIAIFQKIALEISCSK